MPMIMDDLDDLFTDSLSLPPRLPAPLGLQERLDELRSSGSCQYVFIQLLW